MTRTASARTNVPAARIKMPRSGTVSFCTTNHVPGQRSDGDVGEKARYDAKRTMQDYICGL